METVEPPISPVPKISGLAIASLVAILTCFSPLGIVLGHMAMSQIKKSAGQQTGYRMALAGTILSYVVIVIWGLSITIHIKSANREGCMMNIRNVQQAIRGHQGMNEKRFGSPINWSEIIGDSNDAYLPHPVCPSGGTYTFSKVYPEIGKLACTCSHADHVPRDHRTW